MLEAVARAKARAGMTNHPRRVNLQPQPMVREISPEDLTELARGLGPRAPRVVLAPVRPEQHQ
jgi:hypothetical protein